MKPKIMKPRKLLVVKPLGRKKYRRHFNTISSDIKRLLVKDPTMPFKEVQQKLGKKVTEGLVGNVRRQLVKDGFFLVGKGIKLKSGLIVSFVRLNSDRANLMRILAANKGKKTVKEIAEQTGYSRGTVCCMAKQMKELGIPVEVKALEKPFWKGPKLTPEQEKVLVRAKKFVSGIVFHVSSRKGFSVQDREEFASDVERLLPGWIKSFTEYKPKPGKRMISLNSWITIGVNRCAIDFDRKREEQDTGLSGIEVKLRRALEKRIALQENALQRKPSEADRGMFLKRALIEVNGLPSYKRGMAGNPIWFPSGRLSLEHAIELLKADELARMQRREQNKENERD